jgi:hypothetical protein
VERAGARGEVAGLARQTLAAWLAGRHEPPNGAHDQERWRRATWDDLCEMVRVDPQTWLEVSLEVIDETPWSRRLGVIGLWPFRAVLAVGGDPIQGQALAAARADPKRTAIVVEALEDLVGDAGRVWSGMTAVVTRLGVDTAIAANARISEAAAASSDGVGHWESPDFWAFGLGGRIAQNDPELAWVFVNGVIDSVSDETLDYVGASELEDFCWAVAPAFIERIETEAASDPRFRRALASVWPGVDTIPPETYRRIRMAAEIVD